MMIPGKKTDKIVDEKAVEKFIGKGKLRISRRPIRRFGQSHSRLIWPCLNALTRQQIASVFRVRLSSSQLFRPCWKTD